MKYKNPSTTAWLVIFVKRVAVEETQDPLGLSWLVFFILSSDSAGNAAIVCEFGHDRFLPNAFQFITYESSYILRDIF
jgi:hypothetical protein